MPPQEQPLIAARANFRFNGVYCAAMATFSHQQITLAVRRFGHGPLHVLAFHGFGRTGDDFALLSPPLEALCTIHAFDLPYHGHSPALPGGRPVEPEAWAAFFLAYAASIHAASISIMGYSLGGRLALCLLEQAPQLVSQAFLLAPDGLVHRPWYREMAHYALGRWLYQHFILHPAPTHAVINLLHRFHLMDARLHRFIMGRTGTPQVRALLHDVWTGFRLIEPDRGTVTQGLRERNVQTHIFLGENDRVIQPSMGEPWHRAAPDQVHLHRLPTGHRMMNEAVGMRIAGLLRGSPGTAPAMPQ